MEFYEDFPKFMGSYRILDKIGEGTFSSVYKAVDLMHFQYDNTSWCQDHNADRRWLAAASRLKDIYPLPQLYLERRMSDQLATTACGLVAVKRIYATSSPMRIHNEVQLLHKLSGHPNVAPIINVLRHQDQVILVLPFLKHDEFRDFFLTLPCDDVRAYLRALFSGLKHIHSHGVVHRDIKPANFLYSVQHKSGAIVDFGLAQPDETESLKKWILDPTVNCVARRDVLRMNARLSQSKHESNGYIVDPSKPAVRANRAGTRGFRAPEVLLKVVYQTTALDIWSVGVIILSFMTGIYPFFQSKSDEEALLEIALLFGKKEMAAAAAEQHRVFTSNVPTLPESAPSLHALCSKLQPKRSEQFPESAFDLLRQCLMLNPERRITAADALEHPFLKMP
ncbi:kinase-like domain-containing protein [Polychytrium aggregatum]|uniref:kinase-like domain-containing protein n=1 Tax=Polychytrium aggregatum TaxID=110093 RepID=UPI0022FE9EDC|nr:kinase-like domain-containing protein [Polychytrium aggregatum]KAI9202648.1 kinase-like domain-containing protein [Polychytrium aggregatum]